MIIYLIIGDTGTFGGRRIFMVWSSSIYTFLLLLAPKALFCFRKPSKVISRSVGGVYYPEGTHQHVIPWVPVLGSMKPQVGKQAKERQIWGFVWAIRKLDFP